MAASPAPGRPGPWSRPRRARPSLSRNGGPRTRSRRRGLVGPRRRRGRPAPACGRRRRAGPLRSERACHAVPQKGRGCEHQQMQAACGEVAHGDHRGRRPGTTVGQVRRPCASPVGPAARRRGRVGRGRRRDLGTFKSPPCDDHGACQAVWQTSEGPLPSIAWAVLNGEFGSAAGDQSQTMASRTAARHSRGEHSKSKPARLGEGLPSLPDSDVARSRSGAPSHRRRAVRSTEPPRDHFVEPGLAG